MGTDVFQDRSSGSLGGLTEQEGEIIWPTEEDVYVLQSNQHSGNEDSYLQQSSVGDNSFIIQSNDDYQSNDNSYEQQSNVITYTEQSNVQEEPSNDNSYSGKIYKIYPILTTAS